MTSLHVELPIAFSVEIIIERHFFVSTAPNARSYESDRSSRDDKVKSIGALSSTTATTPESVTAKTPSHDSGDDSLSERRPRKPIGGVAVLPPMEMKRIAEDRQSPAPQPPPQSAAKTPDQDRKSPGLSLGDRDSLERKWKQRESRILDEVCTTCRSLNVVRFFRFVIFNLHVL